MFPEILDLTPFTTSGQLSTQPSAPISSLSTPPSSPKVLYRLSSIVCHYGGHTFGHYVAYRRKPRSPSSGSNRYTPPTYDDDRTEANNSWLRISDENVQEVGLEAVLAENSGTFMLFYERITTGSLSTDAKSTAMDLPIHRTHPSLSLGESSTREATPMEVSDSSQGSTRYSTPRIVRSVSAGVVSRDRSVLRDGSREPPPLLPSKILSSPLIPGVKTFVPSTLPTIKTLNTTRIDLPPAHPIPSHP
jgi:ubiquitin carboxyl-terminal hydrolase 1